MNKLQQCELTLGMAVLLLSVKTGSVHSNWVTSWTQKRMTNNILNASGSVHLYQLGQLVLLPIQTASVEVVNNSLTQVPYIAANVA